jgi:hypothetical protein
MPQKKNPDALELLRGKSGRVIGQVHVPFLAKVIFRSCKEAELFADIDACWVLRLWGL